MCIFNFLICYILRSKRKKKYEKWKQDINRKYDIESIKIINETVQLSHNFISGEYEGYYKQNDKIHQIPKFNLLFDIDKCTVNGKGNDEVGKYIITGKLYIEKNVIQIYKQYCKDNEEPSQNKAHLIDIILKYDNELQSWIGEWFVCSTFFVDKGEWTMTLIHETNIFYGQCCGNNMKHKQFDDGIKGHVFIICDACGKMLSDGTFSHDVYYCDICNKEKLCHDCAGKKNDKGAKISKNEFEYTMLKSETHRLLNT